MSAPTSARQTALSIVPAPPARFDLIGPLPEGTAVLEASAGTGKTFTIAALVARYVAEGVAEMDQLLVVSFSRESTRELRERVRERLVQARDALLDPGAEPADDVLRHLLDADGTEVERRARRLTVALASFDAATVTTTHGFCQQVLLALGTAGDYDLGDELVEDIGDLAREVADDLYLRKWGTPGAPAPDLTREQFHALALAVARDPATALLPDPATPDLPGLRARVATAVRRELDVRKRRLGIVDYDDMLLRLARLLRDPDRGRHACARLRDRYRVVLVDEFQDTDPVQWDILRSAFHGVRTMVLIGDPKQSIYAFRGADVHAYLDAVSVAASRHTLPTSYRSDAALLAGLGAVFRGAALGDPAIRVVPVDATHTGRMVATGGAPVRLRVVGRDGLRASNQGLVYASEGRESVARDVAGEIVALLSDPAARVHPRDGGPDRPVQPGDVAVLVRTNEQARLIAEELVAARVPMVLTGRRSVFTTTAAQEWQLLLEALEQPHRPTRVNRLALGCFVGASAADLAAAGGDRLTSQLGLDLRAWARVLAERGVAALFETLSQERAVQQRLLRAEGGERLLTDLRHIAQTLHEAGQRDRLGLTALLTWLRRRRVEAARDGGLERSRRLESDAAAVQVMTVHASKGLEFPVTMVPFGWDLWVQDRPSTAVFHENGRRLRDVGGPGGPDWAAHAAAHVVEETDDELRLAYVALTRAQSQLVLWWLPGTTTSRAPLHRLLMHENPDGLAPQNVPVPSDAEALAVLRARAEAASGALAVEPVVHRSPTRWTPPAVPAAALSAAVFDRELDLEWRRTSYSSWTAAAHEQPPGASMAASIGSEPEAGQRDDESDEVEPDAVHPGDPDAGLDDVASAWDDLPGGPRFGTVVHGVLELLRDPGDDEQLHAAVRAETGRSAPWLDAERLTDALRASLATPLGPLAGGVTLAGIDARNRLPELEFEFALGGGDTPVPAAGVLHDLAPLWRRLCPDGPLAGYADVLEQLDPAPLRGFLTGSVDAVLRLPVDGQNRYLVVDYKTNRLGGVDRPLTAWNYRPAAMAEAMIEAHYPLQALLYDVALHRYLRWRLPGYDPARHLGGVLYLFLRGMTGPQPRCADGSVPGVFSWHPPHELVLATSDLLAGVTGP
ncbi:UvrD-helicase domain-containing protein [Spongisporangium articulatum]|uniref:RecBCD enzyme subunit RecB n=1 Tax=Spongisporangium articulatum TaxID=3362603 RepID=A0ABW8AQ19_9ACTN